VRASRRVGAPDARPEPEAAGAPTTPTPSRAALDRFESAAVVVLVAALVVGAIDAVAEGWVPVSDEALIELRVRDVPSAFPLVGVYSRFGWSHPGPAEFLALTLPYRLAGGSSVGLLVGVLALHSAAVAAAWGVARQLAPITASTVLLAMTAVAAGVPATMLRSPWNPNVVLLAAGLCVVAAWSAVEGRRLGLLLVAPVASFLVQVHVGTAPLAAVLVVAVVTAFVARRAWRSRRQLLALGAGLGFTVVLWLPPIVEELDGGTGNLSELLDYAGSSGESVGWATAVDVTSQAYAARPNWTVPATAHTPLPSPDRRVPVWLAVPAAAAVLAVRRRAWLHVRGLAVVFGAQLAMVVAVAQVRGGLFSYLYHANRTVAALCVAVGLGALLDQLPVARRAALRTAVLAGTTVLAVVLGVRQLGAANPAPGVGAAARQLASGIADEADGRTVALSAGLDFRAIEATYGVLLQLERAGVDVTMPTADASRVGSHRVGTEPGSLRVEIVPLDGAAATDDAIAVHQPFGAAEREAIDWLVRQRSAIEADRSLADAERHQRLADLDAQLDAVRRGRVALAPVLR
jgi:hypothetical protein